MIKIAIPGRDELVIEHVALDYNGTIAVDGLMPASVRARIAELAALADVCVLTADTYGTAKAQCDGLGVSVKTFPRSGAAKCKEAIVRSLGANAACIGNGFNDIQMFDAAVLAIAVLEAEGVCAALVPHADVLVRSAEDALDLLLRPDRLRATLRT